MATRDTTRLADRRTTIPQHTRVRILPTDRERFIHLEVLACFDATATENALIRIVTIKGISVVDFVWLWAKRNTLMFDC